jgi:hypothetical protein
VKKSAQPGYVKPYERRIRNSARPLRHIQTRDGLRSAWQNMARDLYSPRVCKGMPPFVQVLAEAFWKVEPTGPASAIVRGDPAFFVSFQVRLDQIDCAMVRAGRGLAARTPVIKAKYIIDGFMQTAIQVLKEKGGEWPPSAPATDEPA